MNGLAKFDEQLGIKSERTHLELLQQHVLSETGLTDLEIQPRQKFLGPICSGTIGEIFGPRGIGKTQFRDALSFCMTRGLDLPPFRAGDPAGVLILDGEMPVELLRDRQKQLIPVDTVLKPIDFISSEEIFMNERRIINLLDQDWRSAFIEFVELSPQYNVIFFDNLSAFLPGIRENDADAWAPINSFFLQLRWLGRAVSFIHHAGKGGDQRGTSAREDQLDYVIKLTEVAGHNPQDGCKFLATLTKSRSLIGDEAEPFVFEIIEKDGKQTWATATQRETQKNLIIALLGHDIPQKEVCEMLHADKGYVSRIKTWAIKQNLLTESGSLTPAGRYDYGNIDIESFLVDG